MELTDSEIEVLKSNASEGAQLNDLQKTIQNEFKKSITFMETRFLISDLGIEIKSEEVDAPAEEPAEPEAEASREHKVQISVDQVKRPGAMVSGSVIWSDGVSAHWVLDEMGRLSLECADETYQPTPEDAEDFQLQLREMIGG